MKIIEKVMEDYIRGLNMWFFKLGLLPLHIGILYIFGMVILYPSASDAPNITTPFGWIGLIMWIVLMPYVLGSDENLRVVTRPRGEEE